MEEAEVLAHLLFRDGMMLVLDKPAGMAVHGDGSGGFHLGRWLPTLALGRARPPELAHRLDKDTSGCLVLGRHPKALRRLSELFAQGHVEKTYWAVVEGGPPDEQGRVDLPLLHQGKTGTVVSPQGQEASTLYQILQRTESHSLLELRPLTGRTHQLRVHCQALGCPIVGDPRYGQAGKARTQLHARSVCVPLYPRRAPLLITAPTPLDWVWKGP